MHHGIMSCALYVPSPICKALSHRTYANKMFLFDENFFMVNDEQQCG